MHGLWENRNVITSAWGKPEDRYSISIRDSV